MLSLPNKTSISVLNKFSLGIYFLLSLGLFRISEAQVDTISVTRNQVMIFEDSLYAPKKDTLFIISDTLEYQIFSNKYVLSEGFYDSVYSVAKQNRVTKELFNLLITKDQSTDPFDTKDPVKSEDFFQAFLNKRITSIEYVSVDLFGGSVNDTTLKAQSSVGKLSNELHRNTTFEAVDQYLLFDIGDSVDPFKMADSERIIRSLSYIEDARISLSPDPSDSDAVRVILIVKDRFPWSIDLSVDENSAVRVGFINRNILGTGNEFGVGYLYNKEENPNHGYDVSYTVRNIENSFIDGTVFASNNYLGKSKGITFKRDFISPEIKYYGEATLEHVEPIRDLIFADSLYEENFEIDRKSYDLWGARSFQFGKRKNLSFALRLQHDYFSERPTVQQDSNEIYQNHHFLVGGVSYSKINYLKTKNILSFNITEDIPVGFIYSIIGGKDWTEFGVRDYRGFQASYSFYNDVAGYFLFNLESGYFTQQNRRNNEVIQFDGRHFTPLFELGDAYSRIFTRLHFFNGDRFSIPQSQSLLGENRFRNITGNRIEGNKLFTLSTEYVVFQPWYFYGFRFATYAHLGLGHVSESRVRDPFSKTYYTMGGGVRIRNESLVFNTFEFRVSLIPNPPTEGQIFFFKVSISTPRFFESPNVTKPKIVGLD
ncbi:hypothetical protein [Ekhidna sp. To15]|uniref:hypothetical protein n=1 Tax=Ekhidna sp. To15 TaxID=3395267 RepID=UPI003F525865